MAIFTWFAATFKQYPEIAIFLTLALGYYFGKFTFKGLGLGSVTATLLAGVLIGQIGITISQPLKATVFLLFLFAVGYAVTYMFGTVGSAIVIALLGPFLLRFNIAAACKDYEEKQGGSKELGGAGTAWHRWEMRAFRVQPGAKVIGLRAVEAEALLPQSRVFIQRIRRNGVIEEATAETVLREGDVVAGQRGWPG